MIKPTAVLTALACLAGAAGAQSSSVTIYGLVDLSLVKTSGNGQSAMRLLDGTAYGPGSRWGIRVNEDLGSGWRAGAVLEAGVLADTGASAQGGRGFGRQSYLLLSSASAGELRFGRQIIFHDETLYAINPTLGGTVLNPGGIYTVRSGVFNPMLSAPRIDNAIQYLSPTASGFRAQVMVAPGEKTQDRYLAIKGAYSSGPLNVALAYEQSKALDAAATGKSTVNKITVMGASYDFGPAKLFGGYERGRDLTRGAGTQIGTLNLPSLPGLATDLQAYNIGASMPVRATTTLMVNYMRSRFNSASGASATIGRYGAGATYWISKRTALYGVVALASGDMKNSVNEKRAYQLGLRHAF